MLLHAFDFISQYMYYENLKRVDVETNWQHNGLNKLRVLYESNVFEIINKATEKQKQHLARFHCNHPSC